MDVKKIIQGKANLYLLEILRTLPLITDEQHDN